LSVTAVYPNASALEASVSRVRGGLSQRDGLLALRLNSSRLLHSRLAWTPHLLDHVTAGLRDSMLRLGYDAAETWTLVNSEIADEVSGKYQNIVDHIKEELTPIIDGLERELNFIAYKLNEISGELNQYKTLQAKYESLVTSYRRTYTDVIGSWRQLLSHMTEYPVRQEYTELTRTIMADIAVRLYDVMSVLDDVTDTVETTLRHYRDTTHKLAQSVGDMVQNSTVGWNKVKNVDISSYVWGRPEMEAVKASRLYQQGSWAYKYWDVEKSLKTNLDNMYTLLVEIVEEEVREMSRDMQSLYKSPITVWAPEQGEIQADLPLPVKVTRLDEVPDLSPLTKRVERTAAQVAAYLPDHSTWETIKKTVSDMLPAQEEQHSPKLLTKKSRPNKKGGKKSKKAGQMKKYRQ